MPDTLKLNINILEPDCEKVRILADEYLHDELIVQGESEISKEFELSEGERAFIDGHINKCKDCMDFIEAESKYLAEIKLAEYTPEISVSTSVMDTIIENQMIVEKPPKKRIFPIGLLSAAAVVLIMFTLLRGGPLGVFMKSDQNINTEMAAIENAAFDSALFIEETHGADTDYNMKSKAGGIGNNDEGISPALADNYIEEDIPMFGYEDGGGAAMVDAPMVEAAPVPPAASPIAPRMGIEVEESATQIPNTEEEMIQAAQAPLLAPAEVYLPDISIEDFKTLNSDLAVSAIYKLKYSDIAEKNAKIFNEIEIYRVDPDGRYYIIEKKYIDTFGKNLRDNDIAYDLILFDPDSEYVGIIYYLD